MEEVPENVKHDLLKLVPASLFKDITCFAFHDHHPLCRQNIDVIICTNKGEIIELYQRESVLTLSLITTYAPRQISLNRSSKCELIYLVWAGDELFILFRKDEIVCNMKVCNVVSYQIYDFNNVGEPHLRVTISDDAVPVIFDEEYKVLTDKIHDLSVDVRKGRQVNIPMERDLDVKLAITRYNYAYNLKSLESMRNLRQVAAFALYQRIHPNLGSSSFNNGLQELNMFALKITAEAPWIKTCNGRVVLVLPICNENPEPLEEIQILLHHCDCASITYTTMLFQSIPEPPYWQEIETQNVMNNTVTSIAVLIDLRELKHSVLSKIKFKGVIMYKLNGKEKLVPIEPVSLSMWETLGDTFDVFSSNEFDKNDFLAIVATSHKTDLLLRDIQQEPTNMQEALCAFLNMERLPLADNVIVHRRSPYHALNGVMVMFEGKCTGNYKFKASVYSRSESQVLTLIHCINDAVPGRIIVTTPAHKITAHHAILLPFSDVTTPKIKRLKLKPFARALLDQMAMLLRYYDDCMMKMNESRNEDVLSKIGTEIDLFACGVPKFKELKKSLRGAVVQSFEWWYVEDTGADFDSMEMVG